MLPPLEFYLPSVASLLPPVGFYLPPVVVLAASKLLTTYYSTK